MILAWQPFPGGPRLPSVILAAIGLLLFFKQGKEIFQRTAQQRMAIVYAAIALPVLISLIAPYNRAEVAIVFLVLVLLYLASVALLSLFENNVFRQRMLAGLAIVAAVWSVDGFIQFTLGVDLIGNPLGSQGRVTSMFDDILKVSIILPLVLPLLIWSLMDRHPLYAVIIFIIGSVVVAGTGVRGSWLMLILFSLIFFYSLKIKYKLPLIGLVAGIIIFGASTSPIVHSQVSRIINIEKIDFVTLDRVLSGRLYIWEAALKMGIERPLTGVGAKSFDEVYSQFSTRPGDPVLSYVGHAHSSLSSRLGRDRCTWCYWFATHMDSNHSLE